MDKSKASKRKELGILKDFSAGFIMGASVGFAMVFLMNWLGLV